MSEPWTIRVTKTEKGDYCVRSNDRYQDELTADEALYIVARLLVLGSSELVWLKTKEQHEAFWKSLGCDRRGLVDVAKEQLLLT